MPFTTPRYYVKDVPGEESDSKDSPRLIRSKKILNDEVLVPIKLTRVVRLAKKYGLSVTLAEAMWEARRTFSRS